MDARLKDILTDGISQIDAGLNNQVFISRMEKLYDEISLFNPVYKLVAAEGKDIVVKHILDCLAPYPIISKYVKKTDRIADLGSGSGLPGLVLASAFDNDFDLVERMGRRAGFLRSTSALMNLSDRVNVVEKDLSEVSDKYRIITFRAFRQMKDIAQDLNRITEDGGTVLIYKSSDENINEDLQYVDQKVFTSVVNTYKVPFLEAQRSMLILKTLLK